VGFLLLVLPEKEVVRVITTVSADSKYIPQFWKAEAVNVACDGYVFLHLLQDLVPDASSRLQKLNILPETFCQKWFAALCVNVLPFSSLFRFFELFMEHGHPYLIKFGISLVKTCKDLILTASDHHIYAVLRFDESVQVSPRVKLSIVEEAVAIDISKYDLQNLRSICFEKHLKERLARAKQAFTTDDSDDDEEEEGAECEVCGEMAPELYCKDCKKMLCGMCNETKKGGHTSKHSIDEDWPQYHKKADKDVDEITKDVKKLSLQ